jgi:hypothetical protein
MRSSPTSPIGERLAAKKAKSRPPSPRRARRPPPPRRRRSPMTGAPHRPLLREGTPRPPAQHLGDDDGRGDLRGPGEDDGELRLPPSLGEKARGCSQEGDGARRPELSAEADGRDRGVSNSAPMTRSVSPLPVVEVAEEGDLAPLQGIRRHQGHGRPSFSPLIHSSAARSRHSRVNSTTSPSDRKSASRRFTGAISSRRVAG